MHFLSFEALLCSAPQQMNTNCRFKCIHFFPECNMETERTLQLALVKYEYGAPPITLKCPQG